MDFATELYNLLLRSVAAQAITIVLAMITGLKYIRRQSDRKHKDELKTLEKTLSEKIDDVQIGLAHDMQIIKGGIEGIQNETRTAIKYIDNAIDNINDRLNLSKNGR